MVTNLEKLLNEVDALCLTFEDEEKGEAWRDTLNPHGEVG